MTRSDSLTPTLRDLHVPTRFPDENIAAEAAIRFAQDQDALYSIYY